MAFAGVSYLAILIAAILGFGFGAAYYGILGKYWMKAARIEPATVQMSVIPFAVSFIAELVMAWVLAGLIGHLGAGQVTLSNGIISGFFVWLGFMATTLAVNHRYQGFGWNLTLVDGGHWLGVSVIMGAFIGWWGV